MEPKYTSNEESNNSQKMEATVLQSPAIIPLQGEETNEKIEPVQIIDTQASLKTKTEEAKAVATIKENVSDSSILGATSMLTNICLGTTIFTFAVRAKQFGLVWLIVATIFCGAVNYWTILRSVMASKPMKENDFSEITEKLLGRKARLILNFLVILYSYALEMCFIALMFPLFGRFVQHVGYRNKYKTYNEFADALWNKAYIKFPFFIVLAFLQSLICLIKDINKLNFSAYIGVGACMYTLLVVTIQCKGYYNYYKKTEYIKEDKSTHPNWSDLSQAFTSDLHFFKGMASLFTAYSCVTGVYPVYEGFKHQKGGFHKMKLSTLYSVILVTVLHILSITVAFLTEPIYPQDIIIYRIPKDNGKDVLMNIAKFAIAISLFFSLPGYYFGLRLSVSNSFTNGKISNKFNYLLTFISLYVCAFIAAVYDKILNYLSYVGGFFSCFICYLFPILLYIKTTGKPITYWKNLIEFIGAILLCIVGVTAGILTVRDDINGK